MQIIKEDYYSLLGNGTDQVIDRQIYYIVSASRLHMIWKWISAIMSSGFPAKTVSSQIKHIQAMNSCPLIPKCISYKTFLRNISIGWSNGVLLNTKPPQSTYPSFRYKCCACSSTCVESRVIL